jgi:hypothetical protein
MTALVPIQQAMAVLNAPLKPFAAVCRITEQCRRELQSDGPPRAYLPANEPPSLPENVTERASCMRAIGIRRWLLPLASEAKAASDFLFPVLMWADQGNVEPEEALCMLSVLYGTLNKSRTDDNNSQMKLASCAELFDPIHDRIGLSTGLWKSVPRHPIFLALGIKSLIARGVFSPEPSEVAEEVRRARERLCVEYHYTEQALERLQQADAILLKFAPDEWERPYREPCYRPVLKWMLDRHECNGEDDFYELVTREQAKLAIEQAPQRKKIAAARRRPQQKRSAVKKNHRRADGGDNAGQM